MKVTISNIIHIEDPTQAVINYCKNNLVFKNPDYDKKRRMGVWLGNTTKTITIYNSTPTSIDVPIGCFNDLYAIHPIPSDYTDFSVSKSVNVESHINLRNYQEPCLEAVKTFFNGILILPAGTGKTLSALHCFGTLKQKTLWITHTKELLNQAKDECEANINCTTSTITEGQCDTSGDIVFATVQTLVNVIDHGEIGQDTFGMVICDECHHTVISADAVMQFEKCITYFAARYKIGLTATLHTANGLHVVTPKLIGPVIYEMVKEGNEFVGYYKGKDIIHVPASMFQIPARIHLIPTSYDASGKDIYDRYNQTINFSKLISDISSDTKRNNEIVNLLKTLKGSTIIVGDRVEQLKTLATQFGKDAIVVDGKTKKDIREKGLERVKSGQVKYLFASYKLICEGFNAPILENLVMVTPVKDLRIVVQSIGRVQRPYKDKKIANVYDLVDDVGKLDRFLRERKKIYKKEGYEIDDRRNI